MAGLARRVEAAAAAGGGRAAPAPPPRVPAATPAERCRSPSPRSGSGSSTASSRAAAAYNMPGAVRLAGRLRPRRPGARALGRGGARATRSLRTTFADGRRAAGAGVGAAGGAAAAGGRPGGARRRAGGRRERAAAGCDAGARRGRSTSRGPLCCASAWCAWRRTTTCCCVTLHHIVSDGWSLGVLVRELAALYARLRSRRRPPALPELPIQYARLRRLAAASGSPGEAWSAQLEYWRERLAGAPRPGAARRPAAAARCASLRGGQPSARAWTPELAASLAAPRPAERGATPLHGPPGGLRRAPAARLAGAGRPAWSAPRSPAATGAEIEGLIGLFVNTLVAARRPRRRPDASGELLGAGAGDGARRLRPPGRCPSSGCWRSCRPERDLSRTPLFQVFFNMLDLPGDARSTCRASTVEPVREPGRAGSKFDLTLYLADERTSGVAPRPGLRRRPLRRGARSSRWLDQYETLLARRVGAMPERAGGRPCRWLPTAGARRCCPTGGRRSDGAWHGAGPRAVRGAAPRGAGAAGGGGRGRAWSYGELAAERAAWPAGLLAAGVGPGRRGGDLRPPARRPWPGPSWRCSGPAAPS